MFKIKGQSRIPKGTEIGLRCLEDDRTYTYKKYIVTRIHNGIIYARYHVSNEETAFCVLEHLGKYLDTGEIKMLP